MHCKTVRTHPGGLVDLSCGLLVYETTLDHPPSNGTLERPQAKEAKENVPEVRLDVAPVHEVAERPSENDSDRATDHPVEPLPEEDVLEALHVHPLVLVHLDPLRALLVFFKFSLPLLRCDRWQHSVGLPSHHRQATLCEPRVASNPNDSEDRGTHSGEPKADHALLARLHKLFILDVEDNRVERKVVALLWSPTELLPAKGSS